MGNKNLMSLDEFKDKYYGKIGTKKRNKLEADSENFVLGVMLQQARLEKGLTQEQVAKKAGTNKGYISKIENNLKDARLSTLQRIVELGLGGKLNVDIKL